jgi:hypothetical protein
MVKPGLLETSKDGDGKTSMGYRSRDWNWVSKDEVVNRKREYAYEYEYECVKDKTR